MKCNKMGVTIVKNPIKEYAATAKGTLPKDAISLYKNGWDTMPMTLDVKENHCKKKE